MKEIALDRLALSVDQSLRVAQQDKVLILRHGKPYAVVVGLEDKDKEDWAFASSPAFWKMIRERRRQKGIPLAQAEARLFKKRR